MDSAGPRLALVVAGDHVRQAGPGPGPRRCAELVRDEKDPSEYSMKYRSVTGKGKARFAAEPEEKRAALQAIMRHYEGPLEPMPDSLLARTAVVLVDIEEMSGKVSSYPKPE